MVLRTHGSHEPLAALRKDYEAGRDGLALHQLRDLLRSRGMDARMYRCTAGALPTVPLPAILYWEDHHFVVLERVGPRGAVVVDPAGGKRRIGLRELESSFSGRIVTAVPTEDFVRLEHREPNPWLRYLAPLRTAWRRLLAVTLLSLLVFAAGLVAPMLTRRLIDEQLAGGAGGGAGVVVAGVGGFAIALLALSVARALMVNAVTVHVGRESMLRVFGHMLRLPYKYFASRSPGELMYRLGSVNAVRDLVSTHLARGALDLGMSLAMLGYMLWLSAPLTVVAAGFYALIVAILLITRRRVNELLDAEMTHSSKSQSMQLEAVVAAAALRVSGDEERFLEEWRGVYDKALVAVRRRTDLQGWITSGVSTLQVVAPLAVFLAGLQLVAQQELTLGTVVAFQAVAGMFFGLASAVFGCWSQLVQGRSYLNRLADITDQELPAPYGTCTAPLIGQVDVRGVSFRYSRHAPPSLVDVTFTVRPGERVALVGASGSGKSTLGKLLCGLFEPTAGTIEYDGRPRTAYDREHFYGRVGYVPQEVHLLNRSLLENITMGLPGIGEEEVRRAAADAQVHEEIVRLPMQYQTLVAEMGANFSGGQRQRIALARALVKRPDVLVLDEATSALDSGNESRIAQTLREQSCSLVVIAHRLSTVVDADRIHVMEQGRIVQSGTHEEMAHVEGPYRRLFQSSLTPSAPPAPRSADPQGPAAARPQGASDLT
jgi:ABC-type bacteriocin/lantibiotic exporter with double-glycine peptidase domain